MAEGRFSGDERMPATDRCGYCGELSAKVRQLCREMEKEDDSKLRIWDEMDKKASGKLVMAFIIIMVTVILALCGFVWGVYASFNKPINEIAGNMKVFMAVVERNDRDLQELKKDYRFLELMMFQHEIPKEGQQEWEDFYNRYKDGRSDNQ